MRILVTGGLGFIGHNIVQKLESLGHDVVIADNRTDYGIIPKSQVEYLHGQRLEKIKTRFAYDYDIVDMFMESIFDTHRFDIVVHTASFPRQKVVNAHPTAGARVMIEGLLNLLECSKKYGVKRFVYVSSSMVYGNYTDGVTEDAVCNPQGQYGIMKLAGENLVKDYIRRDCFDHVILRPSAVYGPLDVEDRVVAKFMHTAMRGGMLKVKGADEALDFTYITDTTDGIITALLSEKASNQTYNISHGCSRTLLEAAELTVKIAGRGNVEIYNRDNDYPSRGSLDISKAKNDFGFNPTIDIEQGFLRYYEWLKSSTYFGR